MKFKDRYSARVPSKGTTYKKPSMTVQSEYPQTTIDYYLKRYRATGLLGDPARASAAVHLDVSDVGDYQEQLNKILAVNATFAELPADKRREFQDDPRLWVESLVEEAAKKQLAGDLSPSKPAAEPETQPAVPTQEPAV
jgi:hypothetical protein